MRTSAVATVLATLLLLPITALAQQGDRSWIARGVVIAPDDDSQRIADTGSRLAVNTTSSAEFALAYLVTDVLALEAALSATRLDVSIDGGTASGLDGGRVWMAPVALTLQYRLPLFSDYHPYAGLGITYGAFFDYELSHDMEGAGLVDMEWQGKLGLAAQIGLDYDASERWYVNLDVKYLDLGAEVELLDFGRHLYDEVELDVNPWVMGLGVGLRF